MLTDRKEKAEYNLTTLQEAISNLLKRNRDSSGSVLSAQVANTDQTPSLSYRSATLSHQLSAKNSYTPEPLAKKYIYII